MTNPTIRPCTAVADLICPSVPVAESEIIAEVEKLRTLGKDDLRLRWSTLFGKVPPPALTKDMLGRMIAWRIQEKFYGGHDKATLRLLDGLARGKVAKPSAEPKLRPGTVLMLLGVKFAGKRSHGAAHAPVGAPRAALGREPSPP